MKEYTGKIFEAEKVDLFDGTPRKHSKPQQLILSSGFQPESEDQGMFWFGLFQRQAIAAKNTTYSLLTHSLLGQIRDISQKLSWRLTAVFITPSWK